MRERRKHGRVMISAEVNLSSEDNFYGGQTRDISMGGLWVATENTFPIGTEVKVQLKLPSRVLSLQAEVAWVLESESKTIGVGLRFLRLPSGAKSEIEGFMRQRQPFGFALDDAPAEDPSSLPEPMKHVK